LLEFSLQSLRVYVLHVKITFEQTNVRCPPNTLDLLTAGPQFTRPARHAAAAAIDQYLLPRPTSAANPPAAAVAIDQWPGRQMGGGWTDGRTDTQPFYNASWIYHVDRVIGNESVPKIILNNTINLFLKTAISILAISNR